MFLFSLVGSYFGICATFTSEFYCSISFSSFGGVLSKETGDEGTVVS